MMKSEKRWLRFGYASVNFGRPISMSEYCQQQEIDFAVMDQQERFAHIEKLSHLLMNKIADVVPILPVALMSEVVLANQPDWLSELGAKAAAAARIEDLQTRSAPIEISAKVCEDVLAAALAMLEGRGFIERRDGLIRAQAGALDILRYYANSIVQWKTGSSRRVEY